MNREIRIGVVVRGGIVHEVVCDHPFMVEIFDYDDLEDSPEQAHPWFFANNLPGPGDLDIARNRWHSARTLKIAENVKKAEKKKPFRK